MREGAWFSRMRVGILAAAVMLAPWGGVRCADRPPDAVHNELIRTWRIDGNSFTMNASGRITINNARLEEAARLTIDVNGSAKLLKAKVRVLDQSGVLIRSHDKGDFEKYCGYADMALYADICVYQIDAVAPRYPYVIEYEYEVEYESLFFLRGVVVQRRMPVEHARLTLEGERVRDIASKVYGLEGTVDSSATRITWEFKDVAAWDPDEHVPATASPWGEVRFLAGSCDLGGYALNAPTWSRIGLWYAGLAEGRYDVTQPVSEPVGATPLDTVRSIYDEVTENIRYVAVSIGLGSWQPHSARETVRHGYGDCKDMTTLLVSRLRAVGFTAYPALLLTSDYRTIDPEFASLDFNHVITMAVTGTDTVWLDPTCDVCPAGDLPLLDESTYALVVTDTGGVLVRTPEGQTSDNVTDRRCQIRIGADLRAEMDIRMEFRGHRAFALRHRLEGVSEKDLRQMVAGFLEGGTNRFRIDKCRVDNLEDPYQPLVLTIRAQTLRPLDRIGSIVYCQPYSAWHMRSYELEPLEKRQLPLDLYYPSTESELVSITWDSALAIDSVAVPSAGRLECSAGSFRTVATAAETSVEVHSEQVEVTRVLPVEQFAEYGEFVKGKRQMLSQYIKLVWDGAPNQ